MTRIDSGAQGNHVHCHECRHLKIFELGDHCLTYCNNSESDHYGHFITRKHISCSMIGRTKQVKQCYFCGRFFQSGRQAVVMPKDMCNECRKERGIK